MARAISNVGLDAWFEDKKDKRDYFVRFKYAFSKVDPDTHQLVWDKDKFIDCWPAPMRNVGEKFWPIMSTLYADLPLAATTIDKAWGLVCYKALAFSGQYKRSMEINQILLPDWFSEDRIHEIQRKLDANSKGTASSEGRESQDTTNKDFSNNNEAQIDEDGNFITEDEGDQWKSSAYLDASNHGVNKTNSANEDNTSSENHQTFNEKQETRDTTYNAQQAMLLMSMSKDPSIMVFNAFVNSIAATVNADTDRPDDWSGDFK